MISLWRGGVLLLLVLGAGGGAHAAEEPASAVVEENPHDWLQRMVMASQQLNYDGIFVYQYDHRLDAMQVIHAAERKGERERLFSLTGPRREILRNNDQVVCILGDQEVVHVNRSRPRSGFPAPFPGDTARLEKYYRFELGPAARVAGLDCRKVVVRPRDAYRYGRKVCIHVDTGLMLSSELTGVDGRPIERMMFTSVRFPDRIGEERLLPALSDAGFSWKREPDMPEGGQGRSREDSRWKVVRVPAGFELMDHRWHRLSAHEPGVEHWVYSDGLASVSVYIEKAGQEEDSYQGATHRGALNAWGTTVAGHYVTVVGEVPMQTVELIGKSVQARLQ
ncbi:MAG TPA: MucB/RseB [Gammaproteobacteria bacterium]|nr:MucB/RseB [Gammaproteobacteria bacterium]